MKTFLITPLVLASACLLVSAAAFAAESTTVHSKKTTTNPDGTQTVEDTVVTKTTAAPGEKVPEAAAEAEQKSDFQAAMKKRLNELTTEIGALKDQAATASSDTKADLEKRAAALDKKRDEINAQIDQTTEKSGRAWTKFRSGLQKSMTELQAGYDQAKKEFAKKEAADQKRAENATETVPDVAPITKPKPTPTKKDNK